MKPLDDEINDLRAEQEELRLVIERLRARLVALVRVLPVDLLDLLEKAPDESVGEVPDWNIFEGWEETAALVRSDVGTELDLVWKRLGAARGRPG
jgi:hypothetical protein